MQCRNNSQSYLFHHLLQWQGMLGKRMFLVFALLTQCLSSISFAGTDMTYEEAKKSAIDALRIHLSLDENRLTDDIKVVSFTEKQWPDASIGCPRPGINYPQVVVPGYYAKLESQGLHYNVHIGGTRAFVCTKSRKVHNQPQVKPQKLQIEVISNTVKEDLAKRLSMPVEKVKVISIKSVTWPDQDLGCPDYQDSKGAKRQKNVRGYGMILEAKGRRYSYHTDRHERFMACPPIETE